MDLYQALVTRRTIYRLAPGPVPDDVIARALDAARWAPNHKLTEPWLFVVVGPETRARLGQVAARLAEKKAGDSPAADLERHVKRAVGKITDVPALVAVVVRRSPGDAVLEREDYAATACAAHNMMLSLWNDGVGSQWSTGGVARDDESYAVLGLDSSLHDIVGLFKIGYPAEVPAGKRKPLDEVMRRLP